MARDRDEERLQATVPRSGTELRQIAEGLQADRYQHGLSDRWALSIVARDHAELIPLTEARKLVLGRDTDADVTIDDPSISRRHAEIVLKGDKLRVVDLGSTNGTFVNGERVERARVAVGDELTFGVAAATLGALDAGEEALGGMSHLRFSRRLKAEVDRARSYRRGLVLLMLRGGATDRHALGRLLIDVRARVRSFDLFAPYSGDTVEIMLPELAADEALEFADSLVGSDETLRCGLAIFPEHATSVDALVEAARSAQLDTDDVARIRVARSSTVRDSSFHLELEDAGPVVVSRSMRDVYRQARKLASSNIPVLLLGETGTGKEVVARAIQQLGDRRERPMICVNCGAIPEQLVESTLFGHERGAFTGADKRVEGVFEAADGGTILLDEIGELPLAAQAALLRVLETSRFARVGSTSEMEVDVRVIAATHQDLQVLCRAGAFREDLLYRLNAMTIAIPPLRERHDEIEPLASHFLRQANRANGCAVQAIAGDAMAVMRRYHWPGNVRELRNVVARAVVIAEGEVVTQHDLPEQVHLLAPASVASHGEPTAAEAADGDEAFDLRGELARHEASLIRAALERHGWNRAAAARELKLPLRTLSHKMQTHGLTRP